MHLLVQNLGYGIHEYKTKHKQLTLHIYGNPIMVTRYMCVSQLLVCAASSCCSWVYMAAASALWVWS